MKLRHAQQLSKYIQREARRIEKALVYNLEALVAELQNHAKEAAGYEDQTSNLKGSIGGVVLKNGIPVSYQGFDEGADEERRGKKTGLEFINSLVSKHKKGYVVLIVAGMEYATYVENYNKKNVLKKTELELQKEIPKLIKDLKLSVSR